MMGEIADQMIEGQICSWCGCAFSVSYEFPAVCRMCAQGVKKEDLEDIGLQRTGEDV